MGILHKLFGSTPNNRSARGPALPGRLAAKLEGHERTTWVPETREGDCALLGSKFSGLAYIPAGDEWPGCGNCRKPMQLFLQLNASDVPDEAQSLIPNGILQFFYCTNNDPHCEVDCEAFFPFSKAILIRVVEPGPYRELSESPVEDAFPARSIKGWTPLKDFPNWEESESLGIACTDDESDLLGELGIPYAGEKLGGWPAWVQSIEYPDCPECDAPMDLVFQFASEENLPYMFGDVGTGHVTRCKSHPEILTFGWAC